MGSSDGSRSLSEDISGVRAGQESAPGLERNAKMNAAGSQELVGTQSRKSDTLILDGTKLSWHLDRVRQWDRGERFAPVTIDMALTRACNYACGFCYAMLQENERQTITTDVMYRFLDDCA